MWRLHKCCCILGLRKGCVVIALLDFAVNVVVLNFANSNYIDRIEQAVAICHCIGCVLLLSGALIQSTVLLMFFLITSLTNYIILTVHSVIVVIQDKDNKVIIVLGGAIYISIGIYFWIVVYSMYQHIKETVETDEA
ncbi:hypothetical protein KR018_008598 [Drosophila ironensis]|nr:hypothetical protein KR018_008598 [Drosophila ironensis]